MGWWLALLFPLIGGIANLVILLLPSREQKVVPFPAQPNTRGNRLVLVLVQRLRTSLSAGVTLLVNPVAANIGGAFCLA